MANISKKPHKKDPILDTLAQVPPNTLKGLRKRAKSKWYTSAIVRRLKYLEETTLRKYYSHAWNCNNKIYQDGQKLTSKYCNTRVCHVCTRIRTAKLMNGYVDQLMKLGDIEFVTLTVKNCKGEDLNKVVDEILRQIILIIRNLNERKGIKISGIRKLEITYNVSTDTFHPHLHLLVDKSTGGMIVDQWLKRMPNAKREGWDYKKKCMVPLQVVQKADKDSLAEIFKYTTKIIVSKKGQMNVYLKPLNTILECLYKRRCFQPFGIVKMVSEDVDDLDGQVYVDLEDNGGGITEWVWNDCDWVNEKRTLTGYIPPEIEFTFVE
jgi:hypothetical protein